MRCATCGYFRDIHPDDKCPICACGKVPAAHWPVTEPPAPTLVLVRVDPLDPESAILPLVVRTLAVCPSKARTAAGKLPTLRQGSFKGPAAPQRYETRDGWGPILFPVVEVVEVVEEVIRPPLIPARRPLGPAEIAGYQGKQAVGLGRAAAARGWLVEASYALEADGTEFCAVKLARGDLRAVATWTRPAGRQGGKSGWRAELAYGWQLGTMPVKLDVTKLETIIRGDQL